MIMNKKLLDMNYRNGKNWSIQMIVINTYMSFQEASIPNGIRADSKRGAR
jgi:hypothetical protein